ncbi:TadA family conjugal transfer-associated ATPase [Subtercola endophyticus]|uniref:TadA family conjugal transfer-associated ATPase n=1 Tax=Subtercola endophyticus TaxID=2895559 RepID=UPI001E369E82|nr:TadA family conjugal transfer-associated ATPase [Subtercola endophyticus]UFS57818.1 TadA family conjugal transfer-associated ATPase [Subtercola endophyticus]
MTSTHLAPFVASRSQHDETLTASPPSGTPATTAGVASPGAEERVGADDFGPLAAYLRDRAVTDVFINGPNDLWFDRGDGLCRDETWSCPGEAELRQLAVRLISLGGRHIDEANPCVDVRLHDGVRLHAVLPPAAPKGTVISLRVPAAGRLSLDDLEGRGFFCDERQLELVRAHVQARSNMLITGAGGCGKTTLLSALLSEAPHGERIVAIEDVSELRVEHPHFVALEARQANLEGAGEISLERLLREALRMRPDRLVLGECRGAEIRELLSALNTGHDGGAGTLHANSLHDVAARIEAMGALAALQPEAVARQAVSAINVVFHLERSGSRRRLAQIGRLELDVRGRLVVIEDPVPPPPHPPRAPTSVWSRGRLVGASPYDIGGSRMSGGRHV